MFTPPYDTLETAQSAMTARGYFILTATDLAQLAHSSLAHLQALEPSWNALAYDNYLKDGGRYRKRRHSCLVFDNNTLRLAPHRAHWQPVEYNALHGGMERWFEPVSGAVLEAAVWQRLIMQLAQFCCKVSGKSKWFIEAHQFRIDTEGGIGRPTPEGAHRDGVDFVAVLMVGRHQIKGGETRVFEADGPNGQRFTLDQGWSLLFLDDARIIHETTPIQPLADAAHRDTLVLTFRKEGFMG
jgi:hypothetical protein